MAVPIPLREPRQGPAVRYPVDGPTTITIAHTWPWAALLPGSGGHGRLTLLPLTPRNGGITPSPSCP